MVWLQRATLPLTETIAKISQIEPGQGKQNVHHMKYAHGFVVFYFGFEIWYTYIYTYSEVTL